MSMTRIVCQKIFARLTWRDLFVISELGRKVNRCNFKNDELTTRVAAKILTSACNSDTLDEDSIKEINIMFELSHAHVIRFLGVCYGYPNFLVMKYAALGSLNIFLKNNPFFPHEPSHKHNAPSSDWNGIS